MSNAHSTLKLLRKIHLYFGVFISPALIFFAFTGALQTFSLHETTPGRAYKPPYWAALLAQVHKKQTLEIHAKKAPPTDVAKAEKPKPAQAPPANTAAPAPAAGKPRSPLPLKIFFLLASIGLFTSTLTGIYMAYAYSRNRAVISGLLVAGTVIPPLLMLV